MRLKNNGKSAHDFTYDVEVDGKKVMKTFTIQAGEEIVIDKKHPLWEHMSKLPEKYPLEWISLEAPKLTKEELKAQLAEQEAADKAEAEALKKAEAEAKKQKKDEDKNA